MGLRIPLARGTLWLTTAAILSASVSATSSDDATTCRADIFASTFAAAIAEAYPGQRIAAEVRDLDTGCRYSLNANAVITVASIRKIEILAGVLLEAQREGRWLSDWERDRARPMMTVSANQPASDLRNAIGGRARMAQLDALFGLEDTVAVNPWGASRTSARDQVAVLEHTLLNEGELFTNRSVNYMNGLMTSVTASQRWGISSGVPHDWGVALKNGFYPLNGAWRTNSVGMVTSPGGGGYLIAILSDGWPSMSLGITAVERIAAHVANRLTPGEPTCANPTIVGTSGDDVLIGTALRDVIYGRGGDDHIEGRGGDDVLCGGAGNDTIEGFAGSDTIRGGAGDDILRGGKGADVLLGSSGNDELYGRNGVDILSGGSGADILDGGLKWDRLYGRSGDDLLNGGGHDDLLLGGLGSDTCADPPVYEVWLVWSGCERR